jgi:hypothetical protein
VTDKASGVVKPGLELAALLKEFGLIVGKLMLGMVGVGAFMPGEFIVVVVLSTVGVVGIGIGIVVVVGVGAGSVAAGLLTVNGNPFLAQLSSQSVPKRISQKGLA